MGGFWRRLERLSSTSKFLAPRLQAERPADLAKWRQVVRLPSHYQKFYQEWRADTQAVHWVPKTETWTRDQRTGVVTTVRERPIPIVYPHQSDQGLWGGEGVIEGLIKKRKYTCPVPKYWVPRLFRSVVRSDILDKYFSVTVTERALNLIDQFEGFDSYLLKNPANELRSLLALRLKRRLLYALVTREFALDNPEKQAELLERYKDYVIPLDELEWYGLTIAEAKVKYEAELAAEKVKLIQPLKIQFRAELIEELREEIRRKAEAVDDPSPSTSGSWFKKMNPFSKPEMADSKI